MKMGIQKKKQKVSTKEKYTAWINRLNRELRAKFDLGMHHNHRDVQKLFFRLTNVQSLEIKDAEAIEVSESFLQAFFFTSAEYQHSRSDHTQPNSRAASPQAHSNLQPRSLSPPAMRKPTSNSIVVLKYSSEWHLRFLQSLSVVPQWWHKTHDIILFQLALKHNFRIELYIQDIEDKQKRYMTQLKNLNLCVHKHNSQDGHSRSHSHRRTHTDAHVDLDVGGDRSPSAIRSAYARDDSALGALPRQTTSFSSSKYTTPSPRPQSRHSSPQMAGGAVAARSIHRQQSHDYSSSDGEEEEEDGGGVGDGGGSALGDCASKIDAYQDFKQWIRQQSNVLQRLKFITLIVLKRITNREIIPNSIIDIRMQEDVESASSASSVPTFSLKSRLFSDYQRKVHLSSVSANDPQLHTLKYHKRQRLSEIELSLDEFRDKRFHKRRKGRGRGRGSADANIMVTDENNNNIVINNQTVTKKSSLLFNSKALRRKQYRKFSPDLKLQYLRSKHRNLYVPIEDSDDKEEDDEDDEEDKDEDDAKDALYDDDAVEGDANRDRSGDTLRKLNSYYIFGSTDQMSFAEKQSLSKEKQHSEYNMIAEPTPKMRDPFLTRDLMQELKEQVNAMDVVHMGEYMAKFLIAQLWNHPERQSIWDALTVVLTALPNQMAIKILHAHKNALKHRKPALLQAVCKSLVDGTSVKIAAALNMAELFDSIAALDPIRFKKWDAISNVFEFIAHEEVNKIQSNHLLFILMNSPLPDNHEGKTLLQLSLEQNRISFLNNQKIQGLLNHVWFHSSFVHPQKNTELEPLSYWQQLELLMFQPFRFFFAPFGMYWTICINYGIYFTFVLLYSIVRTDLWASVGVLDCILWSANAGYILYEMLEFFDDPQQYFSLKGVTNVMDIIICLIWFVIFGLWLWILPHSRQDGIGSGVVQSYLILFALQIVCIAIRCLLLMRLSPYMGVLLRIIQLMVEEIVKFGTIATIIVVSFMFGLNYIFSATCASEATNDSDACQQTLYITFQYMFQVFTGATGLETVGGVSATIAELFVCVLVIIGAVLLINLLIALMASIYDSVRDGAREQISYLEAQVAFDLSNRDRSMPPPFNIVALLIAVLVHLVAMPFAIVSNRLNLYHYFDHSVRFNLKAFYIGCSANIRKEKSEEQRAMIYSPNNNNNRNRNRRGDGHSIDEDDDDDSGGHDTDDDYNHEEFTAMDDDFIQVWQNRLAVYCGFFTSSFRLCPRLTKEDVTAIHHRGCYAKIKICTKKGRTKALRGITIKEYMDRLETHFDIQLNVMDKMLIKQLTVSDVLFCSECFQPFLITNQQQKKKKHSYRNCDSLKGDSGKVLMHPFRVLLDIISCFLFLVTVWIPLMFVLLVLALYSQAFPSESDAASNGSSVEEDGDEDAYCYPNFDREYLPEQLRTHYARQTANEFPREGGGEGIQTRATEAKDK